MSRAYQQPHVQLRQSFWRMFWQSADFQERSILIVGMIYIISPIDLIPEAVFGLAGLVDDGGVLWIVLSTAYEVFQRVRYLRHVEQR